MCLCVSVSVSVCVCVTYRFEKIDFWSRRAFCGELVLGLSGWGRRRWRGPHTGSLRVGVEGDRGVERWGGRWLVVVSFHKRTCSSTFEDVIRIVHPKIKWSILKHFWCTFYKYILYIYIFFLGHINIIFTINNFVLYIFYNSISILIRIICK